MESVGLFHTSLSGTGLSENINKEHVNSVRVSERREVNGTEPTRGQIR